MPARPSLTPELHARLANLGAGAGDLWIQLWTRCDDDGAVRVTEAQIAQAMGRSVRWVSKAAVVLKQAGLLEGGHGMWKICSTNERAIEETFHIGGANRNERATSGEPAPPPTPPTRVRENSVLVVRTDDDVTDENASPPHTAPPASPARRKRATTAYTPEFQSVWQAYPHFNGRSDKPKSWAKWRELSEDEAATVAANLPAWKASHDWTRDGGQYVPAMERWLAGEKWRASPKPAQRPAVEGEVGPGSVIDLVPVPPPLDQFPGETM